MKNTSKKLIVKNSGIGQSFFSKITAIYGYNNEVDLSKNSFFLRELENLRNYQNLSLKKIETLRNKTLKFFVKKNFYKALRYSKGLPIRGQRTHTNASTAKKLNKINN